MPARVAVPSKQSALACELRGSLRDYEREQTVQITQLKRWPAR